MEPVPEIWKAIPGFEDRYEVSDQGRVRSLNFWDGRRNVAGRILKPGPAKSGHLSVVLGRGNTRQVHALVMLAFEGPVPFNHEVLHLDETPSNNCRANLKYGTRGENIKMDLASGIRTVHPAWIYSNNGKRKNPWPSTKS